MAVGIHVILQPWPESAEEEIHRGIEPATTDGGGHQEGGKTEPEAETGEHGNPYHRGTQYSA